MPACCARAGLLVRSATCFAELLLIFWGLLFIATREEREREPKLKARNFAKTLQAGKEIVTRRRSLSADSSVPPHQAEERPQWESAFQGNNPPAAAAPPPPLPPRGGDAKAGRTALAAGSQVTPSRESDTVATRRASNSSSTAGGGARNDHHPQDVKCCPRRRRCCPWATSILSDTLVFSYA